MMSKYTKCKFWLVSLAPPVHTWFSAFLNHHPVLHLRMLAITLLLSPPPVWRLFYPDVAIILSQFQDKNIIGIQ